MEGASFMWWLSVLPPSQVLRWSQGEPRQVARTCRHFGISRTAFYHWKQRFDEHGEAGLADRPRATPRAVVSKILYLRQQYHFGPGRIADYLRRFHQVTIARSSVPGRALLDLRHCAGRCTADARKSHVDGNTDICIKRSATPSNATSTLTMRRS
jgi:transposase-like protein